MTGTEVQSALNELDYGSAENDVRRRNQLPDNNRRMLLESTHSEWFKHPRYHGKAAFFMNLHRDVLEGAAYLRQSVDRDQNACLLKGSEDLEPSHLG